MGEEKNQKKKAPQREIVPEVDASQITSLSALIAKKDFTISHNGYVRKIKAGEDVSDVPAHYHDNLRAEGVL